jgi:hypothetical protein
VSKAVNTTAAAKDGSTANTTTYNNKTSQIAEGRKSNATSLVYPLENQENYQASIMFEVHSINPYDIDPNMISDKLQNSYIKDWFGSTSTTSSLGGKKEAEKKTTISGDKPPAEKATSGGTEAEITKLKAQSQADEDIASGSKTNRDLGLTTKTMNRRAKLYFPVGVTMQDQARYGEANLGAGGASTLAGLRRGNSLMSSMAQGTTEGLANIFQLAAGALGKEAAQLAAARVLQKYPGGVGQALSIGLQVKINPNSRTMFEGVALRQFTFAFKFLPKSSREAEEIRQIIKLFRTELYPESIGTEKLGVPLGYKFPNVFKLTFMYGASANQFMPQPLLCYLRDVNTTYNPGSMGWHEDGAPTEIDMSLSFQEFRGLTRQDIENGSDGNITYGGTH